MGLLPAGGGKEPSNWLTIQTSVQQGYAFSAGACHICYKRPSVLQYCITWKLYGKDLHQMATLLQATLCFIWVNTRSSLSHQTLNNVIHSLIVWSITCIVKHILVTTIQNTQALFISFSTCIFLRSCLTLVICVEGTSYLHKYMECYT
jgi:hypothetical protein